MSKQRIAVIAGDGIGKETVPEGLRVLDAAARRQISSVAAGNASPVASMAAPPSRAASNSKEWLQRSAMRASARTASSVTSTPMPSPAMTAMRARTYGTARAVS